MARSASFGIRFLVLALAAFVLVLGAPRAASAHDVLESSNPPKGASVGAGPATVELEFNEPVDNGPNEITVTGPDGSSRWDTGPTTVSGAKVTVALRQLGPAGAYTVGYHIVSADGHPVSGSYGFTLTTAGAGTPDAPSSAPAVAAATTQSSSSDGSVPVWVWIVAAVVLLIAGALVARRIAR